MVVSQVELPLELEREIFEFAVSAFPHRVSTFSVVSRYIQTWVESLVYRNVVLDYPVSKATLLLRTVASRPSVLEQNVKRLYVTHIVHYEDAQKIIAFCKNAESIACWSPLIIAPPFPAGISSGMSPVLSQAGLTRLSIQLDSFHGKQPLHEFDLANPVFSRLTHLEIVHPPGLNNSLIVDWTKLHSLGNLEHLAMGTLHADRHAHLVPTFCSLLKAANSLRALVIISQDEGFLQACTREGIEDARLLVLPFFHHPLSPVEYWDGVRQGHADFWTLTEAIVRQRVISDVCRISE